MDRWPAAPGREGGSPPAAPSPLRTGGLREDLSPLPLQERGQGGAPLPPPPGSPLGASIAFPARASASPWLLQEGEFISEPAFEAALRGTYFAPDGTRLAESSRTTPQRQVDIPLGAWMLDGFRGIHGREVSQLRLLDPAVLLVSEDTPPAKRSDVDRYATWWREGLTPPPITVVETWEGSLRVCNGHRRRLAALECGVLVPAWVGPTVTLRDGRKAGLTLEICQDRSSWDRQAFPWPESGCQLDLSGRGAHFRAGELSIQYRVDPDGEIHVASVRVPRGERNKGHADRGMATFLEQVDRVGLEVALLASPLDKRTRLDRLVAFYLRHGFELTGRAGNLAGDPVMRRPARA